MRGGSITDAYGADERLEDDVYAMWGVARKYWNYWNPLSDFMRRYMVPDEELTVRADEAEIAKALEKSGNVIKVPKKLKEILSALATEGILQHYECKNGTYRYQFKNAEVKSWIWKSGSILELYVFLKMKKKNDDCRVSVHLDWDGIVHSEWGVDVRNEIDVLTLKGNMLTFISCKSGNMTGNQALHAMYELETVAERFGGKYIRKVLATVYPLTETYRNRAAEMGIEILQL